MRERVSSAARSVTGGRSVPAATWPWCAAIAQGDDGAFAAFYEAWFDRVFALTRALTRRDEAYCLDLVQEVMLRVVRSVRPLPNEEAIAAWMARTVRSTVIDAARAEVRRAKRERAAVRPESAPVAEDVVAERLAWLQTQLAALPEADRQVLGLRFEQGLTLDQAGAVLGLSGDAAHGKIYRLVGRLRRAAAEVFGHGR